MPARRRRFGKPLAAEFDKQGLDFASLDPIIQRTMLMAALASGSVQKQIDGFARVTAKLAERDDLPHELKRELIVRAYAEYGERLGKASDAA